MGPSLVRVALALIGLHAAVDAFVALEPGTSGSDHLPRGLVTLAVLGAAAVVLERSREGLRAATGAVLGALALEGAAIAVADARAVGARGEDWTGFGLAPAGLVLLAWAGRLAWRSRRPGRLRHVRRLGLALAAVVVSYVLVAPVGIAILATHRPRAAVEPVDLGRQHVDVTIATRDGLRLAGSYVPSQNGAAIVSFPTRAGRQAHARLLARHGYGVLVLDARGYDGSEGDPNLFGWGTAKDVDAAVAWLARRPDVRDGRIGGIGFSVGGEVLLEAAASNPVLRAVVSEGAGARSVREELIRGPRGWPAIPTAAVQTAALAILSGTEPPPSLERLVAGIAPRPVFLISAGRGNAGEELNADYVRAAREPKLAWHIPEAGHVGGLEARPREYERRVVGFFDRALASG